MENKWNIFYDVSTQLLLAIILIGEIVTGFVVDTFSSIREETQEIEDDKKTYCLICGLKNENFEKLLDKTFQDHIKDDHYCWDYVFYVAYILEKNKTELTGNESFIYDKYSKKSIVWLPFQRSYDTTLMLDDEEMEINEEKKVLKNVQELNMRLGDVSNKIIQAQERKMKINQRNN